MEGILPLIFLSPGMPEESSRDAQLLRVLMSRLEVEVLCYLGRAIPTPYKMSMFSRRRGLFTQHSRAMVRALKERASPGRLLWVSGSEMVRYIPLAKALGYRVVREERNLDHLRNAWHAARRNRSEGRFCRYSDILVAASDLDATRLARMAPDAPIHVIPHSVSCTDFADARAREGTDLLFRGSLDHPAHVEGLEWFVAEVLPRLQGSLGARLPRVTVAGRNPSRGLVTLLESHGVRVLAQAESMNEAESRALLADALIVFVPSRSAALSRGSILQAMAAGRPVVCTGRASEGLVLAPTYDIWIADQADAFAGALLRLIDSRELRAQIGARAFETVARNYDWETAGLRIDELLKRLYP
jgi:glycosyltransferase involved in cell wall biosynthesis